MRRFFPFLKEYKKQMIIGPFFKLLEAVFELILPIIMAGLIDNGAEKNNLPLVFKSGGFMLFLACAGLGSALICQYSAAVASQGFGTKVRNRLFAHISAFSHAQLDNFSATSLSNRLTVDVGQMQLGVAMAIRLALRAPFLCIGGLVSAMLINFKLSLIILAALPFFVVALVFIMKTSSKMFSFVQKKLDVLSVRVSENLEGIRVIRAFAKTSDEEKRFENANDEHRKAARAAGIAASLSNPVTTIIINAAIVAIIWFGGIKVDNGEMTKGEIIAFISYLSQILLALIVTANLVTLFTRAQASALRVGEVFDVKNTIENIENPIIIDHSPMQIEFKNVTLNFGGESALSNISFKSKAGGTIGIIGATGSGKSSLVNLIPRFYDTSCGEVLINGINIKNYDIKSLRRKIGVVSQKTELFSGTIMDNLKMGDSTISDEAAKEAAKTAQAMDFIDKLPKGFYAPVSRGGTNLSGGQKQRLSIARALAKKPSVLILDDCASALDFATESALWKAIRQNTSQMTVFVVSQRVSSVKRADLIQVLDDGKLIAAGNHRELFESCEIYRRICMTQGIGIDD